MHRFKLYSRSYCHLCEDMRMAFERLMADIPHELTVLDVDADAKLVTQYDEWVPVLCGVQKSGAQVRLCHYVLDEDAVCSFVRAES